MDVYKVKILYDSSLDKLKLIIVVRGWFHNNEIVGDYWYPTESMSSMNYLLTDSAKHNEIVNQLDYIGSFLQANIKHIFFVKLYSRYGEYFPEYGNYFVISLMLNK